ncbi:unnamed protein product [Caenorhabditis auriculariae]|uniref:Uncharacterized protein n=1 Tax=Caenorhabditis auriculariae TaxID=2777116 RepID=A0A8S1H7H8_9PELO|nr:unnamed protein product [Caenorhabditis auriculariae]
MTDAFAEMMTPTKETMPDTNQRKQVLESVADLCLQQGAYSAAAKKYTQAGDKLKAMRALLKSGDVQKIRFFANTARNKEIFILAANFLQTTDWQSDPAIIKDIETFYTKSQSYEHLANFYKSCAVMEAENWRAFDKSLAALDMALVCVEKANEKEPRVRLEEMKAEFRKYQAQLHMLATVVGALEANTADGIRQLTALAEESGEDDIVPCSRIYSMLIEEHAMRKNWNAAYRAINNLRKKQPNADLEQYVTAAVLDQVCDEMRVERITKQKTAVESDGEDEVDFSHAMQRQQALR